MPAGLGTSGRSPPWCRHPDSLWSARSTTQPWYRFETLDANKKTGGVQINWNFFFNLSTGPTISFHGLRAAPTCFAFALNWGSCRTWTNSGGFGVFYQIQSSYLTWSRSSEIFGPVISVKFTDRPIPDPGFSISTFICKLVKLTQFLNLFSIGKLVITYWSRNLNKLYSMTCTAVLGKATMGVWWQSASSKLR